MAASPPQFEPDRNRRAANIKMLLHDLQFDPAQRELLTGSAQV